MAPDLAKQILGLPSDYDNDDLLDAYDDAIFAVKQFLLQNQIIGKVWFSKAKKLHKIQEAYEALIKIPKAEFIGKIQIDEKNIVTYLDYEKRLYELKKRISNAEHAKELIQLISEMVALENQYYSWFNSKINEVEIISTSGAKLHDKVGRKLLLKLDQQKVLFSTIEEQQLGQEKNRIAKLLAIKNIDKPSE